MTRDFPDLGLDITPDLSAFEAVMADFDQAYRWLMTTSARNFAFRTGDPEPFNDFRFPDAHSVRFSKMNEEAEREMAEWDRIIHGDPKKSDGNVAK